MPFLNRRQIALNTRMQAEKDYRAQLRAALSTPGLPAEQRVAIQMRLKQVGKPRVYDANSPHPPGAIDLAPLVEVDLRGMKKAALVALASDRGLPTSGTKAILVERLLTLE